MRKHEYNSQAKECSFSRKGHAERGKRRVYPAEAGTQSYKYNNLNQICSVSSPSSMSSMSFFEYDQYGNLTKTPQFGVVLPLLTKETKKSLMKKREFFFMVVVICALSAGHSLHAAKELELADRYDNAPDGKFWWRANKGFYGEKK